ncbi:unnamed protein product, partial [Bubo scandiacus]
MGDTGPGGRRPPGASFTIESLLAERGEGGPLCTPSPPTHSPPPAPRPLPEPGDKPSQSYIALISTAILSSPEKKLLLSDIYQWIMDNYPYFKNKEKSWRNSVRHNLSLNECFVKAGRSDNGKGHFWAIHPANLEDFAKGDYHRRRGPAARPQGERRLLPPLRPVQPRLLLPLLPPGAPRPPPRPACAAPPRPACGPPLLPARAATLGLGTGPRSTWLHPPPSPVPLPV